jgi:hypothetical protein
MRVSVAPLSIAMLCASLLAGSAAAEIYKTVDANGNVVYTDVAPKTGGTTVDATPLNSYDPTHVPRNSVSPSATDSAGAALDAHYYSVVRITEPGDDEAVRENAGNVVVAVAVSPALRGDHHLVLTLDDEPLDAEPEDNVFTLGNLDRGTHIATAEIIDASGAIVAQSQPVTFHVLRAGIGGPTVQPVKKPAT